MHRYYDPDTGKYITPDPIGLAGGINPFVYTLNNPINFIDPYGLINWNRVGTGVIETTAGGVGIAVAATSEVVSVGTATVLAVGVATIAVPTFSHGVSEVILGFLEKDDLIPPVTGPAVTALAITGDVNRAREVDLISGAMLLGGNIGTWAVKVPKTLELISSGMDLTNSAIQSKDMTSCE